jgi:hypothetical protein
MRPKERNIVYRHVHISFRTQSAGQISQQLDLSLLSIRLFAMKYQQGRARVHLRVNALVNAQDLNITDKNVHKQRRSHLTPSSPPMVRTMVYITDEAGFISENSS